jgi:hypothetical protein
MNKYNGIRNVKAKLPLEVKGGAKKGAALKNPPSVRPKKNKHAE